MTVVLPLPFHSVSYPPLGQGLREQVLKSPLVCGGTGQESGEGLVCSSPGPRGHNSVRGSFHPTFSNCTARGSLRAPGPLYLQQALTNAARGWGLERKGPCPPESPCPGCCHSYPGGPLSQKPKTFSLVLGGFWRIVWLATGPAHEPREWQSQQSRPFPCSSHCSPFTMPGPGSNLGRKRWWQSPGAGLLGEAAP